LAVKKDPVVSKIKVHKYLIKIDMFIGVNKWIKCSSKSHRKRVIQKKLYPKKYSMNF